MLEPYKVVNPYAEELFYEDDRLQARRDQPKFLNLCKTVAFLNQMKKTVKRCENIEYIEVDKSDIEQAVSLASEILGVSLNDLSLPARDLLDILVQMKRPIFTRKDIMDFSGWTKTRLHIGSFKKWNSSSLIPPTNHSRRPISSSTMEKVPAKENSSSD